MKHNGLYFSSAQTMQRPNRQACSAFKTSLLAACYKLNRHTFYPFHDSHFIVQTMVNNKVCFVVNGKHRHHFSGLGSGPGCNFLFLFTNRRFNSCWVRLQQYAYSGDLYVCGLVCVNNACACVYETGYLFMSVFENVCLFMKEIVCLCVCVCVCVSQCM